jgi:ribosomal protein L21E
MVLYRRAEYAAAVWRFNMAKQRHGENGELLWLKSKKPYIKEVTIHGGLYDGKTGGVVGIQKDTEYLLCEVQSEDPKRVYVRVTDKDGNATH